MPSFSPLPACALVIANHRAIVVTPEPQESRCPARLPVEGGTKLSLSLTALMAYKLPKCGLLVLPIHRRARLRDDGDLETNLPRVDRRFGQHPSVVIPARRSR